MIASLHDTIAAVSTPRGEGAIGLVRLSGPQALPISKQIFRPRHTEQLPLNQSHRLYYGHIVDPDTGRQVDEVLLTVLKAPRTYTCEDMAEINCHGGSAALESVLRLVLRMGARLAEPGEFTKRAFLNGRIDLAQAEAVADIIQARTSLSLRAAMQQLEGWLSEAVTALQNQVLETLAEIEAGIDFPDEDLDFQDSTDLLRHIRQVQSELDDLLRTAKNGKIVREGVSVAIVGRTNVGKSSLLNALLRENRAIVTSIPGTTRDTIEESVSLRGLALRLVDTAGLRETQDNIEQMGIQRSQEAIKAADLLLLVLDLSEPLTEEDRKLLGLAQTHPTLLIGNKADLPIAWDAGTLPQKVICTSIVEEWGIEELKDAIWDALVNTENLVPESAIVTNARHQEALEKARDALQDASHSLNADMPHELVALDLRIALDQLGLIVGKTTTDDILDRIFAQFCIGK